MNEQPFSPRAAERDYPHAWAEVERQIAEVKACSDANIIALGATIVEENGVQLLQVVCATDLTHGDDDDEMPASAMRFLAPIHDPVRMKKLH